MRLWRIGTETREYSADDLSGAGGAKKPGRWNADSEPAVYCSPNLALAVLETVAYVEDAGLPLNKYIIAIEVPDDVWAKRETLAAASLPAPWDAIPAGRASVRAGSAWLSSLRSAILCIPSAIVPEEHNSVINPLHSDAARISAKTLRRFEYNRVRR